MANLCLNLDLELLTTIDREAASEFRTRNEFIRAALRKYLEHLEKEEVLPCA